MVLKPAAGGEALTITRDVVVGRNEACDVVLQAGTVSGKHARLLVQDGRPAVEDLNSTNGTFVNGERIGKLTALKNGDRLKFDVVEFDVVMPPGDRTEVRAAAVPAPDKTVVSAPAKAPSERPGSGVAGSVAPAAPEPRAAPPAAPAPPVSASPPPPPPSPTPPPPPPPPPAKKAPGAWADPTNRPKSKTMFMSAKDLQEIVAPRVVPDANVTEPHLQILSGQFKGRNLLLQGSGDSVVFRIGSEPGEGGIKLDEPGVSAFHATIERKDNRWKVADQMSANGTFVNGAQVTVRYLNTGDTVRFGPVECVFRVPETAAAGARAARLAFWPIVLISFAITVALLWLLLR
jgi:pSer/pThr/pTyr-binding forkhead associated (FHA) protein